MSFEKQSGQLAMFHSKRMQSDAFPKYRGKGKDLEGIEFTASAWEVPNSADEFKFFEGRIHRPDEKFPKQSDAAEIGVFKLWANVSENPKAPNYTGSGTDLAGRPFKISAWMKTGKYGRMLSCRIEEKRPAQHGAHEAAPAKPEQQETAPAKPAQRAQQALEIPF